jgi:hypothetical protein
LVAKSFRPVLRDQPMLLPVDMRDWLPPDHLVWFVLDVVDALETCALERTRRRGGAGTAGYDPRMLFALLVYAYCQGGAVLTTDRAAVQHRRRVPGVVRSGHA